MLFFKAQQEIPKSIEIACVGAKTAQLLESMGFQIAFNGSEEKDIHAVAASFKSWLGDRSVLFPTSDRSLHTISKGLPARQIREVIVYKTVVSGKAIPQQEIYVFTSPSNVEGFLSENTVPMDAHIVAWGKSTAHALESYGISSFILEEPSLTALIAHIKLV